MMDYDQCAKGVLKLAMCETYHLQYGKKLHFNFYEGPDQSIRAGSMCHISVSQAMEL